MVAKVKRPVPNVTAPHPLDKVWKTEQPPACAKMTTVRRNLFGLDRKILQPHQLLDKQVAEMANKSSRVWNFDFVRELPLQGRYVWQRVGSPPVFYATVRRSKGETETRSPESKEPQEDRKKSRFVQATIKDFTRVQKRRSSSRLRLKQLHRGRLRSRLLTSSAAAL